MARSILTIRPMKLRMVWVHVEILNHALDQYIGAKWSHKPNFMGDKKSYITTWSWAGVEYTNRWEKVSCAYEKCARISDFQ